ncbi:unnamed protein product [Paramecium primaurelia]|uniref:Uncharacterized protein n=1 Tax=Paramecium primaurelia TaxID=5886 RepID=A0A8S1L2Z4_PARPR|nr:unnamed protein product [Paramecium primaurelia]
MVVIKIIIKLINESTIQSGILENQTLSVPQITLTQCHRQSNFQVQRELQVSLSQEMVTSRTKKNLVKPMLQALSHKKEDSKNFYHHSTIYNVKEFKELSKLQDYQEPNLTKYTELQTKIMVADFKKKVDAFLQKNNYKTNMIGSKITSSLHELESFQSTSNEEQLNKSLCSNKYTIRTEYKSMKATEILVISNNKVVSRQIISSELIQQRLLKQMEKFLKDDRYNYDLKMQTMIDQYEDIVNKIRQQAYTIKIPQSYEIQMSDYNEFYYKKEEPQIPSLNDKLELLADQIIQEIQQSRQSTPQMQNQINEEQQEDSSPYIDEVVKTEPVYSKEEEIANLNNEQVCDRKISHRKGKPRKKQQQLQQQQQKQQNESTSDNNNQKSQQSSQSELPDISTSQQFHHQREIREKKNNQQIQQPIQIQQQINVNTEIEYQHENQQPQNQHIVQNNNKKHQTIDKQKGKVHSRKITGDTVGQRQVPIFLEVPKEQILEALSEKSQDETQQFEEVQTKKQQSPKQEQNEIKQQVENLKLDVQDVQNDQEEVNQQIDPPVIQPIIQTISNNKPLRNQEQRDAVDLWDNSIPSVIKPTPKPKPVQQEIKNIEQKQEENNDVNQQQTEDIILNQRKDSINSEKQQIQQENINEQTLKPNPSLDISQPQQIKEDSQTKSIKQENKPIVTKKVQDQKEINSIIIQKQIVEQKEQQVDDHNKVDYQQIINEKMKLIEQKLQQPCLDIIDILLASDLVYNVNIENYKISKTYKKQVNHPKFIFEQKDEEEVFSHQVIWRHELQEVIPKLQNLNKQIEILIDENDDYKENNCQKIEEENDESDN